jgi:hypothetical protein
VSVAEMQRLSPVSAGSQTIEGRRLREAREGVPWRRWGPYLSERQWGTVREDYSQDGDAWRYFTHDQARSRAYLWGEDGLAGLCDDRQRLCFALTLWNGRDPILKERLFGLTNAEGNHGEDVKEYYYFLDATPTNSYLRWRYKYPQRAYPYADLVVTNAARGRADFEYELVDTGIFDDQRYFDVDVEYAKAGTDDVLVRITAANRGPDTAPLHLLPTLWFRNTWWSKPDGPRPELTAVDGEILASHPDLGTYRLLIEGGPELLFTENETNTARIDGTPNASPFVKDGINDAIVAGRAAAVNPAHRGTKAAAHFRFDVAPHDSVTIRLRLVEGPHREEAFGTGFDDVMNVRQTEADDFYHAVVPPNAADDAALVVRQALAGMLWSRQHYNFDLDHWLEQHGAHPLSVADAPSMRNSNWFHMLNDDVISMPDTWEYPWYAAWDLAFHAVALGMVDIDFAKDQLDLMLRELYLHPSGQIPAYEWNFGDVNPPVHAWAVSFLYGNEFHQRGVKDTDWLRGAFQKLLVNFTWWVNRKDPTGRNVFEGGFLGLDNIGVFDRSAPLPTGGRLEQADGTAWMALFAQNMFEIALELADDDSLYEDMVLKFLEHFLWIGAAMDRIGDRKDEMWDEEDGFFYDVLRLPDGDARRLKVRSMVGLLPFCAVSVMPPHVAERYPRIAARFVRRVELQPELLSTIHDVRVPGVNGRRLLAVLPEVKLRRVLARILDENEFLSPYGLRSVSRYHADHPYVIDVNGHEYRVAYLPAESDSGLFGGNSNWRGPIWFPMNILVIRALLQYYAYYGDALTVECPTGSGEQMTLYEVAREISRRLAAIFLRDARGRRPVHGGVEVFQADPHWRDLLLFYEYFHGDNGAGLGASHQTGWTGLIARVIQLLAFDDSDSLLESISFGTAPFRTTES